MMSGYDSVELYGRNRMPYKTDARPQSNTVVSPRPTCDQI